MEVLTRHESFFSSMFSGKYGAEQDPQDGSYFIDRSPQYFDLILEFLRSGEIRSLKKLDKIEKAEFVLEAEYYAIKSLLDILGGAGRMDVDGMTWDPVRKSSGMSLSNGNMTATSGGSCSHKTALGTIGITHGVVSWEVVLNQTADCYSAVGLVGESFNYGSLERVGIAPNSWGLGLYPGSHVDTSDRRIQAPSTCSQGQIIKSIYDADEKTLKISVNEVERANYKNVNLEVAYICVTLCDSQGGGYTLRNVESL